LKRRELRMRSGFSWARLKPVSNMGVQAYPLFTPPASLGMMPGISYYLSRWYTKDELAFRISMYIVVSR
jgi:hypothetical protein